MLGLGYLMLGRYRLAVTALAATIALGCLVVEVARPWFEILVLVWWAAVVAHGWFLAGGRRATRAPDGPRRAGGAWARSASPPRSCCPWGCCGTTSPGSSRTSPTPASAATAPGRTGPARRVVRPPRGRRPGGGAGRHERPGLPPAAHGRRGAARGADR
ncbi:hypothetical protein NKH77_17435 [Streptomyces sp. M19]